MGIEQICKTISNLFSNIRAPFPQLSRLPLVCAMIRRPGLSVIQSVANVTKDLNKLGIPTGVMPDGSPNLTIGVVYGIFNENYRALKHDASVQGGAEIGSGVMLGHGENAGGPMVVHSTNVGPFKINCGIF